MIDDREQKAPALTPAHDFDDYSDIARIVYTSPTALGIALVAAQTLWDMTDPSSYYRHLSADPFPGNNEKHVLLAPAKGDYQVSPLTNVTEPPRRLLEHPTR